LHRSYLGNELNDPEAAAMNIKTLFVGIAALAVLGACATATPYQQAVDRSGGYAEQQIEQDRWTVSFAGNTLTDRQTVETYLLYRAAELTQQQGFDHFRVVDRNTDEKSRIVASPSLNSYDPFYSGFACDYRFYGARGARYYPSRLRGGRYGRRSFYGASRYGYYDPFWGDSYDYREVTRYDATAEIIMGRGPKPSDPAYFNADEILQNLAGRIARPEI